MIKTLNLQNGQSVEINSSAGWIYCYQEQFGHDILVVIMPMIEAVIKVLMEAAQEVNLDKIENKDGSLNVGELAKAIDEDIISNAFISVAGMQFATVTNIAWSLAKNADESIPAPKEWLNSFETFPLDVMVPGCLKAVLESSVTKKNYSRIANALKKIPSLSPSSGSQSQPLTEG